MKNSSMWGGPSLGNNRQQNGLNTPHSAVNVTKDSETPLQSSGQHGVPPTLWTELPLRTTAVHNISTQRMTTSTEYRNSRNLKHFSSAMTCNTGPIDKSHQNAVNAVSVAKCCECAKRGPSGTSYCSGRRSPPAVSLHRLALTAWDTGGKAADRYLNAAQL